MPDTNRTRILLLILAGALLIGGVSYYQTSQSAKEEMASDTPRKVRKRPKPRRTIESVNAPSSNIKVGSAAETASPIPPQPIPAQAIPAQTIPPTTTMTGTTGVTQAPLPPAIPDKIAATARPEARDFARKNAGRKDPFLGITGLKPYPSRTASIDEGGAPSLAKGKRLLVPPPPPIVQTYAPPSIPSTEMPEPPSRPMLSHKVRLVAVLVDRAVLKITDGRLRQDNKWPQTVTLGPGEKFESLEVVRVSPDSVTIEEDGERSVKTLERIR